MAKNIKREIIEWAAFLLIGASLYFTDYHTEVIGTLQRIILTTGIVYPTENEDTILADYNLLLEDFEGNVQTLSDWKDKPIFLNFWATWCGPCKKEMIHLDRFSRQFKKNDFSILSISIDTQRSLSEVKRYVRSKKYDFEVFINSSNFLNKSCFM